MGRGIFFTLLLLLAGCSDAGEQPQPARQEAKADASTPNPVAPAAATPAARARLVDERSDLLEFTYGWPAEAAAIPRLNARFEAELKRQRTEALATAREDKAARGGDMPYNSHSFSAVWELFGNSPRLLSIAAEIGTFTGGAHGNATYQALLWDRQADGPVVVADLFVDPNAAFKAMTPAYCKELDRQRAEKRGSEAPAEGADWSTECAPLAEQVVVPVDADKDGKFELLRVLLAPYEAGPYAEGSYELDLPVTQQIGRLLKPGFRASFR